MNSDCAIVRRQIDAFVDGELRGPDVLRVDRHLRTCLLCSEHADEVRHLGELLRAGAPERVDSFEMAGLASTVISRTRAEAEASWGGLFKRAAEDWHWLMIGAGSLAATVVLTATLGAMLAFGPKPEHEDSLAAVVAELAAPPPSGYLHADATPVGSNREPVMMQIENGTATASPETTLLAAGGVTALQMESALFDAVTRNGPAISPDRMDPGYRIATEALTSSVTQLRLAPPAPLAAAPLEISNFRLFEYHRVVAKAPPKAL